MDKNEKKLSDILQKEMQNDIEKMEKYVDALKRIKEEMKEG